MKKLIIATLALTLAAAGMQTARANDTTWATIGKVAVAGAVAGLFVNAIDHNACAVTYDAPICSPPAGVYAPAPPPRICEPPVVVAPAPVIYAPRIVCAPAPIVVRRSVVVYHPQVVVRRTVWRW